jgi:diguanylate cyclase (GGDEF)-like protein/PAS domain S-box-containing protein
VTEPAWGKALAESVDPLAAGQDLDWLAHRLTELAQAGLSSAEAADRAGQAIGELLVEAHLTTPAVLAQAVTLLAGLHPEHQRDAELVARMQGAVAAGHSAAVRLLLLDQQEQIHQAAITARDGAARALRDSEARFRTLFGQAPVGIGIGDVHGRILDVNDALARMLGYTEEEFRARRVEDFMHPDDAAGIWQDYAALVAGELDEFRTEKRYQHKDGRSIWTNLSVSLVRDEDGVPLFQVAVMEDVTDRHRLQQELVYEATHDALTGLPNRALFLQRLDQAVACPEPAGKVAVLFLDLDGFKFVNDSRGHLIGDQVLAAVAARFAVTANENGALLARLAGDEFVVLLASAEGDLRPLPLAHDLLAALNSPIVVDGQQPVHVRASVGVVEVPAVNANAGELLRAADLALHAAKEDGKGQVVVHDPSRTAQQLSRFTVAMNLPGVVERGELGLVYQPLIRLADGELHSVEALLRWNHPELGELPPDLFVGIAEESSAIIPIGRWVLERACADLALSSWPSVNINASVRQLYSPSFVDEVRRSLDLGGLDPTRLRIEVTESVIMHADDPGPMAALRKLAELGVRIVMDDFGTGYSNLAALRRFPLHELKLAGTFLKGLGSDRTADAVDIKILTTLVDLAHSLGLIVTAEGVETVAQDERVRAIGCDVAQGWLYSVPGPGPSVDAALY